MTEEIEENLIKLDLTPVKLRGIDKFGEFHPLNYHPDMFCYNLKDNTWIFYESAYQNNKNLLDNLILNIIIQSDPISGEYPDYIGLNCARVGDYLICAKKYANQKIIEAAENIIDVKQGYARCSICIAGDSIITADQNIYKNFPGDKLLIKPGYIDLYGYDYGFIGGCSGFFENKLLFTGDIKLHPDYIKIKDFCDNKNIEIISLSNNKLRDYGALLFI